jgi:hypothetical protein
MALETFTANSRAVDPPFQFENCGRYAIGCLRNVGTGLLTLKSLNVMWDSVFASNTPNTSSTNTGEAGHIFEIHRITSTPTGGTALSPIKHDTNAAAVHANVLIVANPTSCPTGTIWRRIISQPAVSHAAIPSLNPHYGCPASLRNINQRIAMSYASREGGTQGMVLREGEGMALMPTAGGISHWIEICFTIGTDAYQVFCPYLAASAYQGYSLPTLAMWNGSGSGQVITIEKVLFHPMTYCTAAASWFSLNRIRTVDNRTVRSTTGTISKRDTQNGLSSNVEHLTDVVFEKIGTDHNTYDVVQTGATWEHGMWNEPIIQNGIKCSSILGMLQLIALNPNGELLQTDMTGNMPLKGSNRLNSEVYVRPGEMVVAFFPTIHPSLLIASGGSATQVWGIAATSTPPFFGGLPNQAYPNWSYLSDFMLNWEFTYEAVGGGGGGSGGYVIGS